MASSSFYSGTGVTPENTDVTPVAPSNISAIEDSKNAAALSEAAAAASAAASATSATSGAASATTAATKASESASSATASATSASASQASRVASEAAKVASETAKTAAETARDAAAASSTSASSAQAAAETAEANAETAATNAAASASSASSSASAASTSASEAAASAASINLSSIDIDGGTIDGTVIGGSVPAAGNFTTGSFTGNVAHGDGVKATFGNSADLVMYHDGSNSLIQDLGTGILQITSDGTEVKISGNGANSARFFTQGETQLFTNGNLKLATKNDGIDVTGTVVADGSQIDLSSSRQVNTQIATSGSGYGAITCVEPTASNLRGLELEGQLLRIGTNAYNQTTSIRRLQINDAGETIFYEDTGADAKMRWLPTTEELKFEDNVKATFGASRDLQVYHDGNASFIQDVGTGDLNIQGTNVGLRKSGSEYYLYGAADGAVTLYHDGVFKLTTSLTGVSVYGSLLAYASSSNDWALRGYNSSSSALSGLWYANDSAQFLGRNSSNTLTVNINSNGSSYLNGGKVGIGTTSPAEELTIRASVPKIQIEDSDGTNQYGQFYHSAGITAIQARNGNTDGTIVFQKYDGTTNDETVRIDSGGNLEMTGGGSVGWANFTFVEESGYLYVYNGSTKIMRVDASGNAAFAGDVEANATL